MLHPITHDLEGARLWCGPAAIAAVTGQPTSVIHRLVKIDRGNTKAVRGMFHGELFRVMRRLGYAVVDTIIGCSGIAHFAQMNHAEFQAAPMIAATDDHYFVLFQDRLIDNGRPAGVPITANAVGGDVQRGWIFERVGEPDIPPEVDVVDREGLNAMARARRLATKHEICIDTIAPGQAWNVWCPLLAEDDPHENDNGCYSRAEVLDRVESYVRHLTTGYLEAVTAPFMLPESHPAYRPAGSMVGHEQTA